MTEMTFLTAKNKRRIIGVYIYSNFVYHKFADLDIASEKKRLMWHD